MDDSQASVKLTSKHQLTIPAQVVRQLRLSVGDRLVYRVSNGTFILVPRPSVRQKLGKVQTSNAKANHSVASDASIRQTLRQYHRSQTETP